MSKVLVGFDFSTGSAKAVDLAIDIANRMKTDLMLVSICRHSSIGLSHIISSLKSSRNGNELATITVRLLKISCGRNTSL